MFFHAGNPYNRAFMKHAMQVYQVGGAVRDELLGMEIKDRDWVVVGSSPAEMTALGYLEVGKDFPVFLHPDTKEEYALARAERKTGPGYRGFAVDASAEISLEADLQRRDFTINAMARDANGNLIDPYGGAKDLEDKIIRHVSPAFVEDPLRALRAARFAAQFDFAICADTQSLLQAISASGELKTIAPERVWVETEKALQTARPWRYFETLRECGALAQVFPEIDNLFGVPQPEKYHPEIDSGVHTMLVLEQAKKMTDEAETLFAALTHDLGKATTPREQWPSHRGHEQRSAELVQSLCDRLRAPKKYRELALIVARYHLDCHRIEEMKPATVLNKLEAVDAFRRPERFAQFLIACEADLRGRTGLEHEHYPQSALFKKYHEACLSIDAKSIAVENLQGPQIAEQIRLQQIEAIRQAQAQ